MEDWMIEEAGLVNLIRREGAPCVVKVDGRIRRTWKHGLRKARRSAHGQCAMGGGIPGVARCGLPFTRSCRRHAAAVSWYHPAIVYDGQVAACISEPKTMEILADQAKRMKELWSAPLYMMSHDEFRCCNWTNRARSRHETPARCWPKTCRQCTSYSARSSAVWSDMFDPFTTRERPYYLVNGPWTDSWEGLEKNVLVLN